MYWMQNTVNLKATEELIAVQEAPTFQASLIILPYIYSDAGLLWAYPDLPAVSWAPQQLTCSVSYCDFIPIYFLV